MVNVPDKVTIANRGRVLLIGILSLLWGSEWIAARPLADLPRLEVFSLRCLIGAITLLPLVIRSRTALTAGFLRSNILLGITLIAAPVVLSSEATTISPGLAVLLFAMTPIIAGIAEGGLDKPVLLLGGLLGIAFLVRGTLSFSAIQGLSILWILLAVFSTAISMVKARQSLDRLRIPASIVVQLTTAALVTLLYALGRGAGSLDWTFTGVDLSTIAWIIVLGICASATAYVLFYRALATYQASQVATLQWLIPVVSFAGTTVMFHHLPSWDLAAGAALALFCAGLLLRDHTGSPQENALTLEITSPPARRL